MTLGEFIFLWLAMTAAIFAAFFSFAVFFSTTIHCKYRVPVVGHPHVMGCSEYPRPIHYKP